ncbi:hypothetical protein PT277_02275 [Acetobacteraceae bacterium ESL0709]|nr:hypothetical protein [Acetobacteraceae bacterium ESL0697]MDF7677529.1 hypothetical protein [Acetobacteraceae bacterium ESL0709]
MSFFRKAGFLALIAGLSTAFPTLKPAAAMPEPDVLAEAQEHFQHDYAEGGMSEVTEGIINCYAYATTHLPEGTESINEKLRKNRLLKVCLLLDLTARNMDQGMRRVVVSMGHKDPGPVAEYYSAEHYNPRLYLYSVALFPTAKDYHDYVNGSFEEITKSLGDDKDSSH